MHSTYPTLTLSLQLFRSRIKVFITGSQTVLNDDDNDKDADNDDKDDDGNDD